MIKPAANNRSFFESLLRETMRCVNNRRRGNKELTEAQQRKFWKVVIVLISFVLLWICFAPGVGLVQLFSKKREHRHLAEMAAQLEQQNILLQEDIRRFHEDPVFLEEEARKTGLIQKDELIFDFRKPEKK